MTSASLASPTDDAPAHPAFADEGYRALFQASDAGFCVIEMAYDGAVAVDYLFLEVNGAFERQTGLVRPAGRWVSELLPTLERHWFEVYGQVARDGRARHFENGSDAMGRWFDVHAFPFGPPGSGRVAILFNDISDRRAAEAALRDSQERLQQALSAGQGVGTWDWDVPTDRVVADERFARLYGVDPALAAAGAPIAAFFASVHPDDLGRLQPAIADAIRTGDVFAAEYRLVQADGTVRWVSAQGRCKRGPDGAPGRFPGVSFDLTERKRSEARQAALLELGDRLRDMDDPAAMAFVAAGILARTLEVSRAGYGLIDPDAETITIERDWNAPGVRSIAGVLRFRDHGSYIDDLKRGETVAVADVRTDPRTRREADVLEAISAGSFVNMPLLEGGRFVALLFANHAGPRVWDDGDLALMREMAERVRAASERVRAEAARRDSEERFRGITNSIDQMVWSTRPDGFHDFFNDRWYEYTGVPYGSTDGEGWNDVFHPDDQERAWAVWRQSLDTGATYRIEYRLKHRSGVYRWVLGRALPVRNAAGAITRWFGTCTDIQEIVDAREVVARSREELERQVAERTAALMVAEEQLRQSQKMEAVGQLTGGIAHDFNNLLTGITGSLELLNTRIAQGRFADVERYTAAAGGAARRAAALTHRLLAFSRRQTLDPKPTNVNALVSGLEDLVRRTVGPAVSLTTVASGGLWATLVDPTQLENAVLNLCINARDAMPDGGHLTIETANRWLDARAAAGRDLPAGQYVSLCVSDTGTGMTPEVVAKAFDPFFTTKPIGVGTGLGLSMIYGFARQSGGQARIYSEPGLGTTVCLYLPRHRGEAEMEEAAPAAADAPRAEAGETVLVVDDEPTVRMLVTEVLEELGYAAIEAADGPSGLRVLESDARIDLLVTDVGLPGGMNGRQMADAARRTRPALKVLFITGYAENAVVGNGQLGPGMHVMTKPFALDALATRIRALIAGVP